MVDLEDAVKHAMKVRARLAKESSALKAQLSKLGLKGGGRVGPCSRAGGLDSAVRAAKQRSRCLVRNHRALESELKAVKDRVNKHGKTLGRLTQVAQGPAPSPALTSASLMIVERGELEGELTLLGDELRQLYEQVH